MWQPVATWQRLPACGRTATWDNTRHTTTHEPGLTAAKSPKAGCRQSMGRQEIVQAWRLENVDHWWSMWQCRTLSRDMATLFQYIQIVRCSSLELLQDYKGQTSKENGPELKPRVPNAR